MKKNSYFCTKYSMYGHLRARMFMGNENNII